MLTRFDHVIASSEWDESDCDAKQVGFRSIMTPFRPGGRGEEGGVKSVITLTTSAFETAAFGIITVFALAPTVSLSPSVCKVAARCCFSLRLLFKGGSRVSKHLALICSWVCACARNESALIWSQNHLRLVPWCSSFMAGSPAVTVLEFLCLRCVLKDNHGGYLWALFHAGFLKRSSVLLAI